MVGGTVVTVVVGDGTALAVVDGPGSGAIVVLGGPGSTGRVSVTLTATLVDDVVEVVSSGGGGGGGSVVVVVVVVVEVVVVDVVVVDGGGGGPVVVVGHGTGLSWASTQWPSARAADPKEKTTNAITTTTTKLPIDFAAVIPHRLVS